MITFEESTRTIKILGRPAHYNEAGSGPALLGFHGGGPGANGWGDNTKWNIDALTVHHQVLLIDLPGYGDSPPMEALPGETQDAMYARFIEAFLNAKGLETAFLYGTSMSASPAVTFAHNNPQRVPKLVLKSPSTGANLLSTSPPDGIKALGVFRQEPTLENMQKMMELFIPKPGLLTDEIVEARFQSALKANAMPPATQKPSGNAEPRAPTGRPENAGTRPLGQSGPHGPARRCLNLPSRDPRRPRNALGRRHRPLHRVRTPRGVLRRAARVSERLAEGAADRWRSCAAPERSTTGAQHHRSAAPPERSTTGHFIEYEHPEEISTTLLEFLKD